MGYRANYMILPFDRTHDFDLGVSRSVSEKKNNLISGVGRPIDIEHKGCESSIHDHDID